MIFSVTPALRLPARQALRVNFSQRLMAGVHSAALPASESVWIPAFAGMTV